MSSASPGNGKNALTTDNGEINWSAYEDAFLDEAMGLGVTVLPAEDRGDSEANPSNGTQAMAALVVKGSVEV